MKNYFKIYVSLFSIILLVLWRGGLHMLKNKDLKKLTQGQDKIENCLSEQFFNNDVSEWSNLSHIITEYPIKLVPCNELSECDLFEKGIKKPFAYSPQCVVDSIYSLLEKVDNIFDKYDIPYMINSGTQLGATRHGGLIPWDDDADIMIRNGTDEKRFLESTKEFIEQGMDVYALIVKKVRGYELVFYQICHRNGRIRTSTSVPYPALDVFTIKETESGLMEYATKHAREVFPDDSFNKKAWNSRVRVQFGHLNLLGFSPEYETEYLNKLYGKNWDTTAVTNPLDHETLVVMNKKSVTMNEKMFEHAKCSSILNPLRTKQY